MDIHGEDSFKARLTLLLLLMIATVQLADVSLQKFKGV
jgi:hypothetical protein